MIIMISATVPSGTQGVFDPHLVRINLFVDDPILAMRGHHDIRRFHAAMVASAGLSLGLPEAQMQEPPPGPAT